MSSLTPVSRDSMRLLKAQKDEEKRVAEEAALTARVKAIVSEIYRNAINTAETTTETSYKHQINVQYGMADKMHNDPRGSAMIRNNNIDALYTSRMTDILAGLQQLFPDCSVAHKSFIKTHDGKMHDISTMNVDIIPFIPIHTKQQGIVVDWS